MDDVKNVIAAGHKEIWLLGQNVNSYRGQPSVVSNQWSGVSSLHTSTISSVAESQLDKGQMPPLAPPNTRGEIDSSPLSLGGARGGIEVSFAQLLKLLSNIPGDFKIYFTSNHPKDMSYEIIEAIANLQKVAKSIHFPLQSGSNKILKAMNRPYTKEKYLEIVNKIKDRVPGVKLTTDTIIGFPGETEEDFQETVDLFKKINFHQAYNNKYSPRSGTAAFKLGDPIPWSEKQRRWKILNEMVNK